jgi:hypothetical protein
MTEGAAEVCDSATRVFGGRGQGVGLQKPIADGGDEGEKGRGV